MVDKEISQTPEQLASAPKQQRADYIAGFNDGADAVRRQLLVALGVADIDAHNPGYSAVMQRKGSDG